MADVVCARCGERFSARSDAKWCAPCKPAVVRERAAAWYAEHREDPAVQAGRREASRRSYLARRDDQEAADRQKSLTAAWRAANRDAIAEYERTYRRENAARIAEKNRRRRARLMGAWDEDVNLSELLDATGGACGICHEPIDTALRWPHPLSLTLDHIEPLSRGGRHAASNCQPAHAACNSRKGDRASA